MSVKVEKEYQFKKYVHIRESDSVRYNNIIRFYRKWKIIFF